MTGPTSHPLGHEDDVIAAGVAQGSVGAAERVRRDAWADRGDAEGLELLIWPCGSQSSAGWQTSAPSGGCRRRPDVRVPVVARVQSSLTRACGRSPHAGPRSFSRRARSGSRSRGRGRASGANRPPHAETSSGQHCEDRAMTLRRRREQCHQLLRLNPGARRRVGLDTTPAAPGGLGAVDHPVFDRRVERLPPLESGGPTLDRPWARRLVRLPS
jgi:hypothetical protein